MQKKAFAMVILFLLALGSLGAAYTFETTRADTLDMETKCEGTVDKKPGEFFTAKITFKNKGTTEGSWEIAVTFEGDTWTWKGEKKSITLEPGEKKTLSWEGDVPEDAPVDSVARLIVYYDNEFAALNWWIHIIPDAELCIVYSEVS